MTALLALVLAPLFSGSVKWLKARPDLTFIHSYPLLVP